MKFNFKKYFCILTLNAVLFGCATGKCINQKSAQDAPAPAAGASMTPPSKLDRVKVYKTDGSLQCGQGKAIPVADMQKELQNIQVYSSVNKSDGKMRMQLCGSPTGRCNVYEIDRKDLEAATKLGFKEWTFDN